jgi:FkbH-like protein
MKLVEALEIAKRKQPETAPTFCAYLVCGFEPLHFRTFLSAELIQVTPDRKTEILSGLYGDFWGNLDRMPASRADAGLLVCEWSDFDPRMGIRSGGTWAPSAFSEILANVRRRASDLVEATNRLSRQTALVVSLPTIPLPPIAFAPTWQASDFNLELQSIMSSTALNIARIPNVKLVNAERLNRVSPMDSRLDARSELAAGFPYKLAHASALADMICRLVSPRTPKKGLITDLDDTLWSGILGEEGVDGVFWDLEHHSQPHGLYQRLLRSLSETGVLIAAATKNDPQTVDKALDREDLLLSRNAIFPVEAHWNPKSESVSRILEAWNIGADSVVFIDDSPMELAEVKATHPEIECVLFPKDDAQGLVDLLYQLRDLFGKSALSEEDSIRRESIQRSRENAQQFQGSDEKLIDFLAQAEAELTLNFSNEPSDPRPLELVNKTNQFNLNGRRYNESTWRSYLREPEAFLLVASYRDKYGPLGKIAILAGRKLSNKVRLDTWVMSCRAFSRRIEQRCVAELFSHFAAEEIVFDFQPTAKNGPLREFLTRLLGEDPGAECRLSKQRFDQIQEKAFHRVAEARNG